MGPSISMVDPDRAAGTGWLRGWTQSRAASPNGRRRATSPNGSVWASTSGPTSKMPRRSVGRRYVEANSSPGVQRPARRGPRPGRRRDPQRSSPGARRRPVFGMRTRPERGLPSPDADRLQLSRHRQAGGTKDPADGGDQQQEEGGAGDGQLGEAQDHAGGVEADAGASVPHPEAVSLMRWSAPARP